MRPALVVLALLIVPFVATAGESTQTAPYVGASPPGEDLVLETCESGAPIAGACFDLSGAPFVAVSVDPIGVDGDRANLAVYFRAGVTWRQALVFCLNGGGLVFTVPDDAEAIAVSNRLSGCAGAVGSFAGTVTIRESGA